MPRSRCTNRHSTGTGIFASTASALVVRGSASIAFRSVRIIGRSVFATFILQVLLQGLQSLRCQ